MSPTATTDEDGPDVARRAAAYAVSFDPDDAPRAIRDRAALVLLDTVGVSLRGSTTPHVVDAAGALTRLWGGTQPEGATTFSTADRRPPAVAAYLNAAGGTTLELDEGNQRSAHPGIHTVPPALAVAESVSASGEELFGALVAGYEVGARLGDVIRPMRDGLHPHGGWAPVSGAVAAGRLLGLDERAMAAAVRMAVTPFVVGHWDAALTGATVRDVYTGACCHHGITAAGLADAGLTGVEGAVEECLLPYTAARPVTPALLAPFETLGERYYLADSYVKQHAACRYAHAPLDALDRIRQRTTVDPADVERITVETFELGCRLDSTRPGNVLAAKFSTPYALAASLITGESGVDAFTETLVADDRIRSLAERVDVAADEAFEARSADGEWGARLTIDLADGTTLTETVRDARGGGDSPYTREEVLAKFDRLAGDVLPDRAVDRLRDRLLDVRAIDDVSTLFDPVVA
jgi:2-methylcitrate dehydratase PrpD